MATDTFVKLPADGANAGQKSAVQQRVQGADTVVLPKVIVEREAVVTDVFRISAMLVTALSVAAQNGTTTGFLWIMNPAISTRTIRVRRCSLQFNFIGVTTLTTLPRLVLQRFTWSGTPSGASVQSGSVSSSAGASVADIRTASTGLTITLINPVLACDIPPMAQVSGTAASFETNPTFRSEMIDANGEEDEWIVIPPGQGLVLYQADAGGATTETRRVLPTIVYDEINLAG